MAKKKDTSVKAINQRKRKKILTKIVSIFIIIVAIMIFGQVGKKLYTMLSLQKQAETVEQELKALEDENASLISTRDKLEDPNYVQTYARGEYMFSKGDEKVFYLPSNAEGE